MPDEMNWITLANEDAAAMEAATSTHEGRKAFYAKSHLENGTDAAKKKIAALDALRIRFAAFVRV